MKALTDEAKDVSDGGDEDHQEVVEGQYDSGDEEVSDPAELFSSETQRDDWRTDLKTQINTHRIYKKTTKPFTLFNKSTQFIQYCEWNGQYKHYYCLYIVFLCIYTFLA